MLNNLYHNVRHSDQLQLILTCIARSGCRQIPASPTVEMVMPAVGHLSECKKSHNHEQACSPDGENPV